MNVLTIMLNHFDPFMSKECASEYSNFKICMDSLIYSDNLSPFTYNFQMFLPEIFLATTILVLVMHSSLIVSSKNLGYPLISKSINTLSILSLFLCLLLVINSPFILNSHLVYQNTFIFDFLSYNIKQIILIGSIFCLLISESYVLTNRINNFEYFILLLCAILALMFLISSFDFLSFYLAIEMQSLCFYVLAASKKDSSFSIESGLKYFILGSFSSVFLLFGIAILYGCCGTTNFENFSLLFSTSLQEQTNSNFLLLNLIGNALICICISFFFKIGAAPFHMWLPDVYEGSPTSISLFFATIPKIVLFASFLRIFQGTFFIFSDLFLFICITCCIFSVLIGSFVALRQKKLKRLLAYSSISHVGYLLLAFSSNSIEGTQSLFFYILIYMLTSFGLWSTLLSLNTFPNVEKSKTLIDLAAISSTNPLFGFSIMLFLFSLAGIPPLAGFFAKIEIFINALNASLHIACFLAILSSIISAFYYIRLVKIVYFEKNHICFSSPVINQYCSIFLAISTFSLFYFFINPCFLILLTQKMALSIFSFI
jgi:NADH-quinone oxidoreductase subunit N